jgi:hypothetical protein
MDETGSNKNTKNDNLLVSRVGFNIDRSRGAARSFVLNVFEQNRVGKLIANS